MKLYRILMIITVFSAPIIAKNVKEAAVNTAKDLKGAAVSTAQGQRKIYFINHIASPLTVTWYEQDKKIVKSVGAIASADAKTGTLGAKMIEVPKDAHTFIISSHDGALATARCNDEITASGQNTCTGFIASHSTDITVPNKQISAFIITEGLCATTTDNRGGFDDAVCPTFDKRYVRIEVQPI